MPLADQKLIITHWRMKTLTYPNCSIPFFRKLQKRFNILLHKYPKYWSGFSVFVAVYAPRLREVGIHFCARFKICLDQSHERKVGNRRWRHWTKISAKSVTKKNPCLPSTFSSKMPPCEMFVYFRNFLKKHLVTPYSSNGSGLEDKNRSFSFFSLIEKNSKHISSSIFSRLKLWQRKNRRKNWRLTKIS